jgi:hypothetical protein
MRPSTTARRSAAQILLGCLLGVATVGAVTTVSTSTASAASPCAANHVNVEGDDYNAVHYGNLADIYVNTASVINNLNSSIFRSIFVLNSFGNDVEVGWMANDEGYSDPTVYAEWINRGADSSPQPFGLQVLNENSYSGFFVDNVGHVDIFRFYVGDLRFNYSPTMTFNTGYTVTNSEHYNQCDSLWTEMNNLEYQYADGTWSSSYNDLVCYSDDSVNAWLLNDEISNSEVQVDLTNGTTC